MSYKFKKGNIPWNKGLTKYNDERISKYGKKISEKRMGISPWNKGLRGHISWSKGLTKENDGRIKKMSEKLRGKSKSKEHNIKNSLSHKGQIAWNKGVHQWANKKHPRLGKYHSESTKEKIRLKRLNQIFPLKDTRIEVKIQKELNNRNIKFLTHIPILGQPDIFINRNDYNLEKSICIFCDGCYWHSCNKCFDRNKFTNKQRGQIVKDQLITQKLINLGFKVLRFWECDINNNFEDKVLDEIIFTLNEKNIIIKENEGFFNTFGSNGKIKKDVDEGESKNDK